jgi:hypothetical protein
VVIKAIAQEVYKCQSRVHTLEDQLRQAKSSDKAKIEEELRQARAELKQVKTMLESRKEPPSSQRRRFSS